jgi:hypothetical protein
VERRVSLLLPATPVALSRGGLFFGGFSVAKVLSLFHAPCGGRLSRVRLSPSTGWQEALAYVAGDMTARSVHCPRCKLAVRFGEVLPSVDDQGFVPVRQPDESGLVGFGPGQEARPGEKL